MRTKYKVAFVGGLFVGAVVSGVMWLWLEHAPNHASNQAPDQVPDRRAFNDAFLGPAHQVEDEPSAMDRPVSDPHFDDGPMSSNAPAPPPPFLLPIEDMQSWSMLDHFEQRLREQTIDGQWAQNMESRIYELLADIPIPMVQVQLHCRTTICRLEIGFDIDMAPELGEAYSSQILEPFSSLVAIGGWRIDSISFSTFGNFASPWSPGDSSRTLVAYFHSHEGEYRLPRAVSQDVDASEAGLSQWRTELRDALFDERRRAMESSQDP